MKIILVAVFMLLIFSCGGDVNTNYNGITLKTKSKFQDYKNKEIVIYSNISESAIQEYKTKSFVHNENIQSFSNEIKCKDINPNYIQSTKNNSYSYNGFVACYNYDMSKTDFNGNKTYIITIADLSTQASDDNPPNFNSDFKGLFSKEKIKMLGIFKDKYAINEIKKDNSFVWIYRNVNSQALPSLLERRKDSFIYKLPKDETITCETVGYSPDDYMDEGRLKTYRINYTVNNKVQLRICIESEILESDNHPEYGNNTYIIVKYPE